MNIIHNVETSHVFVIDLADAPVVKRDGHTYRLTHIEHSVTVYDDNETGNAFIRASGPRQYNSGKLTNGRFAIYGPVADKFVRELLVKHGLEGGQ